MATENRWIIRSLVPGNIPWNNVPLECGAIVIKGNQRNYKIKPRIYEKLSCTVSCLHPSDSRDCPAGGSRTVWRRRRNTTYRYLTYYFSTVPFSCHPLSSNNISIISFPDDSLSFLHSLRPARNTSENILFPTYLRSRSVTACLNLEVSGACHPALRSKLHRSQSAEAELLFQAVLRCLL